jgi:solute carrier family 25 carnitine/acylcarnitine transporter 20/29
MQSALSLLFFDLKSCRYNLSIRHCVSCLHAEIKILNYFLRPSVCVSIQQSTPSVSKHLLTCAKGATAPILGYGALNALLFVSYNRTLGLLGDNYAAPNSLAKIWVAGAVGGLASFIVSAPTELIKCRTQVSGTTNAHGSQTSLTIAKEIWARNGVRGLYFGGGVTSVRDAVGYGFYFWSYEICKRVLKSDEEDTPRMAGAKVLLAGGIAGVITWASIFPLDVIKTRVQTQPFAFPIGSPATSRPATPERQALLAQDEPRKPNAVYRRKGAIEIARLVYQNEGIAVFFRGLGICSVRAFVVNAVQWAVYEWLMKVLQPQSSPGSNGGLGVMTKANTVSVENILRI